MRTLICRTILVLILLVCARNAFPFNKSEVKRLARKLDDNVHYMLKEAIDSRRRHEGICKPEDEIQFFMRTAGLAGKAATFHKLVDEYERHALAKAVDNMLRTSDKIDDLIDVCAGQTVISDWREIKHILRMLDREVSERRRQKHRRYSLRRHYDPRDVVLYEVIRRGYRDRESDVYEIYIEFSDVTSEAEVKATLEEALLKNYQRRRNLYDSVVVRGYYVYPNAKLGEVYWEPGYPPSYTIVERRKAEDFIDLLLRIFE